MQAERIKTILSKVRLSFDSRAQHVKPRADKPAHAVSMEKGTPLKSLKLKTNKETISSNKNAVSIFSTMNRGSKLKKTQQIKANNVQSSHLYKGMNDKLLFMRKQNHLNTYFNIRKNKLKDITKVNQQLYKRLNTQKSFYSNSELSKSYQSTKSIQERLSGSKISSRINMSKHSSRKSLKSNKSTHSKLHNKKQEKISLKAKDINKMNANEVNSFQCLFIRDYNNKTELRSKHNESSRQMAKFSGRKYLGGGNKMKSVFKLVAGRKSVVTHAKINSQGGLLHRIEQDMYQNKQNIKRSSLYVEKRKLFTT